jgi:hypothetical protein
VTQPAPKPVPPDQVVTLAHAVIHSDRFPVLATLDGDQPRARPVSPVRTDGYRIRPTRVRFMREWALEYHEVPLDAGSPA